MSEPKKQHYVPQTYLRNFSFKNNDMEKIWVFSKIRNKKYVANVSDTSAERHFYSLDRFTDKYIVENFFAEEIEPILKKITDKILFLSQCVLINDWVPIISNKDKIDLTTCVVYQLLRSTNTRNYAYKKFQELLPDAYESVYDRFGKENIDWSIIDSIFFNNKEMMKEISIEVTLNKELINKMINILYDKIFLLMKISGNEEFVTSDNPVMLLNSLTSDVTPFKNGISQNSTIIYYPLTSKILLGIFDSDSIFKYVQENDCSLIKLKNDSNFISKVNKKQLDHCKEYVYSHRNEDINKL